ncbi:hypothetical protein LMG28727_04852 [Paraburkholderia kirstenboschensis]|uniref:hypothetical protein n=1 Tax=Paraburkholderia kirstenboschensis TaxID=1245436 RepID=UPI000A879762|nr:hypothetical protein [Paraburkholderia kirstenboschensis]CAD6548567.1 hypothetical protein LMG28727_04852 [Paraburkholderia kirstenboschensis]
MEDDAENVTECLRERAAIMEIDDGLKRHDAEYYAVVATWRFCQRTGVKEPTALNYRFHSREFTDDEAREPGSAL